MIPGTNQLVEVSVEYREFNAPDVTAPYGGWDNNRMAPWSYVGFRGGGYVYLGRDRIRVLAPGFVTAKKSNTTTVITPPSPSATPVSTYDAPIPADLLAILRQIDFPNGTLTSSKAVYKSNETITLNFSVN